MPQRVRVLPLVPDPLLPHLLARLVPGQSHALQHGVNPVVRYICAVIDLDHTLQGQRVDLVPRVRLPDDALLLVGRLDVLPPRSLQGWYLARGPVARPAPLDSPLEAAHSLCDLSCAHSSFLPPADSMPLH